MSLGAALRSYSSDPKVLFSSFKRDFIQQLIRLIIDIRTNPTEEKTNSWISLEDENIQNDAEIWAKQAQFSVDIVICNDQNPTPLVSPASSASSSLELSSSFSRISLSNSLSRSSERVPTLSLFSHPPSSDSFNVGSLSSTGSIPLGGPSLLSPRYRGAGSSPFIVTSPPRPSPFPTTPSPQHHSSSHHSPLSPIKDTPSPHILLERWHFSFKENFNTDAKWNSLEENSKIGDQLKTTKTLLTEMPLHSWLKQNSAKLTSIYGSNNPSGQVQEKDSDFDHKIQETVQIIDTAYGVCSLKIQCRSDISFLSKAKEGKLLILPSYSRQTIFCHPQVTPPKKGVSIFRSSDGSNHGSITPGKDSYGRSMLQSSLAISGSPPISALRFSREENRPRVLVSCLSPTDVTPFVGSFEESLLSGRMSDTPFTMIKGFGIDLGIKGAVDPNYKNPGHIQMAVETIFYHVEESTPYLGVITIDKRGYRVPIKGTIVCTIINPSQTPVKTFIVEYSLEDMPTEHKTFLRQKMTSTSEPPIVYYAINLRFSCPKPGYYYLTKNIKLIFPHRVPDDSVVLVTNIESPKNPQYFPY